MPTTTFNPFRPWFPITPSSAASSGTNVKPPKLEAGSSDPGIHVKANTAAGSVVFTGVAKGDLHPVDAFGIPASYSVARGVHFSAGVEEPKTTDAVGRTDYTEKNKRSQGVTPGAGWKAKEVAERLAVTINDARVFTATVKSSADGLTATLKIVRR